MTGFVAKVALSLAFVGATVFGLVQIVRAAL